MTKIHISLSNKPVTCRADKNPCPRKHYSSMEEAKVAAKLLQDLADNRPNASYPPKSTDTQGLQNQARIYAGKDLWSGSFRNYEEDYTKGFIQAYRNNETNNYYKRINMPDLKPEQFKSEAFASGKARASLLLREQQSGEEPKWVTSSMSYYGNEDYPFKDYKVPYNPIKPGTEIIIPAGTAYTTTGKQQGVQKTKRATKVTVETSNNAYTDGGVGKRFLSPPEVTASGTGGYWKRFVVTPELLQANNLPLLDSEPKGVAPIRTPRDLEKRK